jgi:hypothetical protein
LVKVGLTNLFHKVESRIEYDPAAEPLSEQQAIKWTRDVVSQRVNIDPGLLTVASVSLGLSDDVATVTLFGDGSTFTATHTGLDAHGAHLGNVTGLARMEPTAVVSVCGRCHGRRPFLAAGFSGDGRGGHNSGVATMVRPDEHRHR